MLHYLPSGHVYIKFNDDCDLVVDELLETNYDEEFCLAGDFSGDFLGRLMEAGFLVMSAELPGKLPEEGENDEIPEQVYILLPKLHLTRSVLFFHELHIKKRIRPFLSKYELRINTDFELILDKCVEIHGSDWLTPPLVEGLKGMHQAEKSYPAISLANPVSFSVYREGELKAGEIGINMGRVYTSYSGYYEEDNAGMVQIILMAKWLEKAGFDFIDLGMPLEYKTKLGAREISPGRFVELFRASRY